MKIAIIGRSEILYDTATRLRGAGHEIACVLTARESSEYARTAADFRELANAWHIPFAQGARIAEHADFLHAAHPDIGISVNYPGIIPQGVIDQFPHGILNAHGGDLPRYRGNACQAWAILNGEKHIGLCIHKMVGGELDSGDIIVRDYLPITHNTKVTRVWEWMNERTPVLFLDAVSRLAEDPHYILQRQSTNPADALRCYPRKPEDGRIVWSQSAEDVLRLINASNKPYAGSFCEFQGEKMIIWDAELIKDDEIFLAVPGQVTKIAVDYIEVACGTGKISLKQVEFEDGATTPDRRIKSIRNRLK